MPDQRQARDLEILDLVDRLPREPFRDDVWRAARDGRDPIEPSKARGRWSDGTFDVLYTSAERSGAVSEIFALLSSQPVFPSQIKWRAHRLAVQLGASLRLADVSGLAQLGIDSNDYSERRYERSQAIAEAAYFLGFDGLVVPSARWPCQNVVLFVDRVPPSAITVVESEQDTIDWTEWHRQRGGQRKP